MRFHLSRTSTGIVLFVLAVAVCLAVAPVVFTPTGADESGAAAITFGQPTISGIQGVGFEQDIRLDPTNAQRVYTSVPGSLSSDTSWIWHSEDGGKTFKWVVAGIAKVGKVGVISLSACAGGGDTELAVDTGGNLYFNERQVVEVQVAPSVYGEFGVAASCTCREADDPHLAYLGYPSHNPLERLTAVLGVPDPTRVRGEGAGHARVDALRIRRVEPDVLFEANALDTADRRLPKGDGCCPALVCPRWCKHDWGHGQTYGHGQHK